MPVTLVVRNDHQNDFKQNEHGTGDPIKEKSANIFYAKWKEAEAVEKYADMKVA